MANFSRTITILRVPMERRVPKCLPREIKALLAPSPPSVSYSLANFGLQVPWGRELSVSAMKGRRHLNLQEESYSLSFLHCDGAFILGRVKEANVCVLAHWKQKGRQSGQERRHALSCALLHLHQAHVMFPVPYCASK